MDSVFVRAPFLIVNPVHTVFKDGVYEFIHTGRGLRVKKVGGANNRDILNAPHAVLAGRSGSTIEIGADLAHMRKYYGEITISRRPPDPKSGKAGGLSLVNLIDTFNYVASVVGGETAPAFGKEALKAQAVLVNTRLWCKGLRPSLKDTTDDMVYLGAEHERPDVVDAVSEIGQSLLFYQGRPAEAFFHACCAGRTSKGTDIFGESAAVLPYLKSVACNYCKGSPLYGTTVKQIPASVFQRQIADGEPKVLKTDKAKRIVKAEIHRQGRAEVMSGYQLWLRIGQKLGWDKAPGTRFEVKKTGSLYVIKSSGGGHGVGFCQWGAQGLARQNKSYTEILQYYFPGTKVEKH